MGRFKTLLLVPLCVVSLETFAQSDSLNINKIDVIEHALNAQKAKVRVLESLISEKASKTQLNDLSANIKAIERQLESIDSIKSQVIQNSQNIKVTAEQFGVKIDETNMTLNKKADSDDLQSKTILGGVLLALLGVVIALVAFLLGKRISKGHADVDELKKKAEKLNEDIVGNFSLEMAEMQKISASLGVLSQKTSGSVEPDHSLIKTLADRITFMEMTLYKMDKTVRGYKQLSKSISQMKNNLLANGYELVDMLGMAYDGGMKVIANFVEDEELEVGKQIITGIIKPQINYKGIMIQAAQITVSQNI